MWRRLKPWLVVYKSRSAVASCCAYGGRVLGLFAPGQDENFYWTHPALESVASARAFYASDQWHNSGGDRTWLSPEADIFLPQFPDLGTYFQPRQLDPGQYRLEREGATFRLVNRLHLTLTRSQITVDLEIAKSFGPAPNPLRYERDLQGLEHLEYAGYTQHTSLEMFGAAQAARGAVESGADGTRRRFVDPHVQPGRTEDLLRLRRHDTTRGSAGH